MYIEGVSCRRNVFYVIFTLVASEKMPESLYIGLRECRGRWREVARGMTGN